MAPPPRRALFGGLAIAALVSTFALILLGAYVVKLGAGLSCPTWPGCFDDPDKSFLANWIPFVDPNADLHGYTVKQVASEWTHRLLAGVVLVLVAALTLVGWRSPGIAPRERALAYATGILLISQIALGGVTVLLGNAPWTVVLHQGNAMLVFGALVALVVLLYWRPQAPGAEAAHA